ncbi:hypothetical protein [Tenacibaculum sp. MAR_2010_89]|uniref:hypothetical protein n=1 Tax=Tenacibaculum sp. MAR_2010_89 TaxID=1250198 RepID=UPI000B81AC90|nr:hypothetical protein [Tenacibaculum sp. MAR_2010_89]
MKTLEKTKEGIINEGLSEESFEGVEVNSENEFTEFDENNNEEAALDDYHEVSNENETILGEDTDSEEPFLGGNSELNENVIENTEDDTLEKIEGYDYSVVDSKENTPQSIEGEGLNAYYGSYGDADLAELMRTESGQKMVQEVVIGKDDRKKINGTTKYPWRAICSLKIKAKDGTSWIGTGFFNRTKNCNYCWTCCLYA